jgi:hypothetical protein
MHASGVWWRRISDAIERVFIYRKFGPKNQANYGITRKRPDPKSCFPNPTEANDLLIK